MSRISLYCSLIFLIVGCGASKKRAKAEEPRKITVEASNDPTSDSEEITPEVVGEDLDIETSDAKILADSIVNTALTFSGTRYKYGGVTRKGMDCSGLVYVAFGEQHISLPRISYQIAEEGRPIKLKKVTKGDLLFFSTGKKSKRISHVGLVVAVDGDDIKFIHSTTSRGVIVSSLREGYWNHAFVKATRIL
jgi:cell wall-associated NlpC family hydrolase